MPFHYPPIVVGPQASTVELCELCALQLNSSLQLAYHNVSGAHLKKLRAHLIRFGLGGYCYACNEQLYNPKEVSAHIEKEEHKQKLLHGAKSKGCSNGRLVCDPCCLQFNEMIGWELHLSTCRQKGEGVTLNFPTLRSLLHQLSGSSVDIVSPNCEPFCNLCEEKCESLGELFIHLLSPQHIQYLRMSSCYACKKDFLHLTDLEKHLFTFKHESNLQVYRKFLSTTGSWGIYLGKGYFCHPCSIWCKSWQSFTLHLLDDRHRHFSSGSKRLRGVTREFSPESNLEWMKWKEQPINMSAWCYQCSRVLTNPEATERHLAEHCSHGTAEVQNFPVGDANLSLELSDIWVCGPCAVGFRNSFALTAHEAFQQHSVHISALSNPKITGPIFKLVDVSGASQEKPSEICKVSGHSMNQSVEKSHEAALTTKSLDLNVSEGSILRATISSDSLPIKTSREQELLHSNKVLPLNGPKVFTVGSTSKIPETEEESHRQKNVGDDIVALDRVKSGEDLFPFQAGHGKSYVSYARNNLSIVSKDSQCSTKTLDSSADTLTPKEDKWMEDNASQEHRVDACFKCLEKAHAKFPGSAVESQCGENNDKPASILCRTEDLASQTHTCPIESPLVAAAVLLPQSSEASLQSAIRVLLNTLTASISGVSDSSTSLSEKKRLKDSDLLEKESKRSKTDLLRDALVQGLSSWHHPDGKFPNNSSNIVTSCNSCPQMKIPSETNRRIVVCGDGAVTSSSGGKETNLNHSSAENSGNTSCLVESGEVHGAAMVVAAAFFQPSTNKSDVCPCENGSHATDHLCSLEPANMVVDNSQGGSGRHEIDNSSRPHFPAPPAGTSRTEPLSSEPHDCPASQPKAINNSLNPVTLSRHDQVMKYDTEDESESLVALQARFFSDLDSL